MSQACAGGCGRWLIVGTHAFNIHRGWWCFECAAKHKATCSQFAGAR